MLSQGIRKHYIKTLGTSVIYSTYNVPSQEALKQKFYKTVKVLYKINLNWEFTKIFFLTPCSFMTTKLPNDWLNRQMTQCQTNDLVSLSTWDQASSIHTRSCKQDQQTPAVIHQPIANIILLFYGRCPRMGILKLTIKSDLLG